MALSLQGTSLFFDDVSQMAEIFPVCRLSHLHKVSVKSQLEQIHEEKLFF